MKILTVIGARPQFIKAAVVSKALRERPGLNEFLVHTGQHFDLNMSGIFFEQMGISKPDANLGISGGSHAEMTGEMLVQIERLIIQTKPHVVLVFFSAVLVFLGILSMQFSSSHLSLSYLSKLQNLRTKNRNRNVPHTSP